MSRLEEIKARRNILKNNGYTLSFADEDIEWLIKQSQRVQELERQNQRYEHFLTKIKSTNTSKEIYQLWAKGALESEE